jgi:hypothetical protein
MISFSTGASNVPQENRPLNKKTGFLNTTTTNK